ncbi:MAG: TolC family protein [Lachnospiraceae bacterium]|nr:TolC family protein [Lachnospiraceae bacterium]
MKRLIKRAVAMLLSLSMTVPSVTCFFTVQVKAADRVLTLSAARSLALQASDAYESAEMNVSSKQAARDSALKALKVKKKNLSTFRWTPLLNFKFPQKPDFSQASEFQFKPLQLASDLDVAQHKLQDTVFDVNLKVTNLYVELVTTQDNLAFHEEQLEALNDGIAHNQARLKMGEANKSDVERLQKKADTLNNTIAGEKRTLAADLKRLSEMIGLDVTTGYTFEKPYTEAKIDRSMLPALITYTEDRDQNYYEACAAATTAKSQLTTNYSLILGKYGKDTSLISGYISQALNGQKVSTKGFKKDYDKFLKKIDSYWDGRIPIVWVWWIPLIWIPREWLKGDLDGIRYIEDDPYVLYQNVLDYIQARKDEEAARTELDQNVEDNFNQYISVRTAYEQAQKDLKAMEETLKEYEVKNRMGLMTFEEYEDAQDEFEELQNAMLDTMKLYTDTQSSFDRLTCGGISAFLTGTDADLHAAVVGESYVEKDTKEAKYFLKPIIQRQLFELSIFIPEDFPVEITDFELWCDNVQVGGRIPKDQSLRELTLTKERVDKVIIRLYNGSEFVDDCTIDPEEESGTLNVTTAMNIRKQESGDVGTYEITVSDITGLSTIKIIPLESEGIGYFRILTKEGEPLGDGKPVSVDEGFTHLSLVSANMAELKVELYDKNQSFKYAAYFDAVNKKIKKNEQQ